MKLSELKHRLVALEIEVDKLRAKVQQLEKNDGNRLIGNAKPILETYREDCTALITDEIAKAITRDMKPI